ncbi:MAG: hybrid sensor histidine kinase/response regulator [Methylococcales bacterium]
MQPIAIFLNLSNAALERGDPNLAQDYLQQATAANQALCADINAMLDISELDAGFVNLQYSSFDLRELADEVIKESLPYANERKVELRASKNHALKAIANSDRHHLKRILANLVVNAIKYADKSKAAAHVSIAIVSHNQKIRVDVIDNGIGIPYREQENIFNPLYQLNNPERDREKGKGLGLSIVKTTMALLEQHTIKLISNPSIGTRFSLRLPKGDTILPITSQQPNGLGISLNGLFVLLVENDPLVKQSLMALLQNQDADVEAASSLDGLRWLLPNLERDPDLLISDYRLDANFTANDVINTVNTHFGYDLPCLILTGETADLSQELPGRTLLHKPIDPRQLLAEIHRLAKQQD